MALNGEQFKRLHQAILSSFDHSDLEMLTRFELETDLDQVVGSRAARA